MLAMPLVSTAMTRSSESRPQPVPTPTPQLDGPQPGMVLLVRHGQSIWNAAHRWQGMADAPLSELGRAQADAAAETLATMSVGLPSGFGSVWASSLKRAAATAEAIAARLGHESIAIEPRLREIDAGPWEGLTPQEIEAGWPGYLEHERRPDGFEPADAVISRTLAGLTKLSEVSRTQGAPIVIVTHSGIMRSVRLHLGRRSGRVANLEGLWIEVTPEGRVVLGETVMLVDPKLVTPGSFAVPN